MRYLVKSPIKSGRRIHAIDATIELSDEHAKLALSHGHIEPLAQGERPGTHTSAAASASASVSGNGARQAPQSAPKKARK